MKIIQVFIFVSVCLLFCSCNNNTKELRNEVISLADSLELEYHYIDKLPEIYRNKQLFLNKEKLQIIIRDTASDNIQSLNFSHILNHILNLKVFNDSLLFIDGIPNFVVLNLNNNEYEAIIKNMDMTSNPIFNNGNLYIAGINYEADTPYFSMNVLDYCKNQLSPFSICDIEPKEKIEDLFLTGHLLQTENRLIFIYDWIGEYYILDRKKEFILKNDFLPLLGNDSKFEKNIGDFAYYQAYSADVYNNNLIFVLREVDFETVDPLSPNEKSVTSTLRKRIHIFNENMELKNSCLLVKRATQIKIIENYLYTLHHKDNKIYIYEIHI